MNQKLIDKGMWWEEGVELVSGCSPCSPGCDNCWSADMTHRFTHPVGNISHIDDGLLTTCGGKFNGNIQLHPERLTRFNTGKPKVFAIWNDWCHEDIDHIFRHKIVLKAEFNEQHIVLALTKRPHVMVDFWKSGIQHVPANWWNGLTICTQPEADEKIPVFLQVPGKLFLCLEPLLERVDLDNTCGPSWCWRDGSIRAVIVGTETGPRRRRRPAKLEWIESIIDQCDAAGVPVFVKALEINGKVSKDINDFPQKLRRRELPWIS